MKKMIIGTFSSRNDAEEAINDLHRKLKIESDEISYIYRNIDGEEQEVDVEEVSSNTPKEGAKKGAKIGGVLGAIGGIAAVAGALPLLGPILVAGPIMTALGITGVAGGAAAGAVTGGAAGGLVGALANWGVDKPHAKQYNDRVMGGDILVAAHSEDHMGVSKIMSLNNARDVDVYEPGL